MIAKSRGPSGENAEYLFMLEEALEALGPGSGDEHVKGLGNRVRALIKGEDNSAEKGSWTGVGVIGPSTDNGRKTTTGNEQAEVEKG